MKHPNIVPIYEIGEQDSLAYLALELVEGGSLAEALAKRPMASRPGGGDGRDTGSGHGLCPSSTASFTAT